MARGGSTRRLWPENSHSAKISHSHEAMARRVDSYGVSDDRHEWERPEPPGISHSDFPTRDARLSELPSLAQQGAGSEKTKAAITIQLP